MTIFFSFFTGLLLAYFHWKSQCLQLLEHVGVRIQVELWWTQNGSIQDSRWELEDASKLVGIFGNDEICSQCCKFFPFFLFGKLPYSIPTFDRNCDDFCPRGSSRGLKIIVFGSSLLWTCRILNICFDFFIALACRNQQQIFEIHNLTRLNRWADWSQIFWKK